MANEGRLSLTPLPKNKDQLARIGELLSNQDEGILYTKLSDGSIVPIKGDSYFRLLNFYKEFWNTGTEEPSDSPSHTWLNENDYDKNMDDLNAILMIKEEDENGDLKWKAVSLHSKAESILIDEDTSETLDQFINRHNEFYDNVFDLENENPDPGDPDVKKHWIKKDMLDTDDEILSGAIMVKSNSEENDYLALSPTTLSKDVIVDLERGHSLDDILPNIYDMQDELELFMQLKDKIILNSDLEERVEDNEYGIIHAHDFTKDEIAGLRQELNDLMSSKDDTLDDNLKAIINDLRTDLEVAENDLSNNINSVDSDLRSRILEVQYKLDEQDTTINNHTTKTILNSPVHGMRVNNGQLEYAINENTWVSVVRSDMLGEKNGVATLDSDGIIPSTQLPSVLTPEIFIVSTKAERATLNPDHGDECYVMETELRYIWDNNERIWVPRKSQQDLFTLTWDSIENKPSSFTPETHGNEVHSENYISETDLEQKIKELGLNSDEQFMNTWGGM